MTLLSWFMVLAIVVTIGSFAYAICEGYWRHKERLEGVARKGQRIEA